MGLEVQWGGFFFLIHCLWQLQLTPPGSLPTSISYNTKVFVAAVNNEMCKAGRTETNLTGSKNSLKCRVKNVFHVLNNFNLVSDRKQNMYLCSSVMSLSSLPAEDSQRLLYIFSSCYFIPEAEGCGDILWCCFGFLAFLFWCVSRK